MINPKICLNSTINYKTQFKLFQKIILYKFIIFWGLGIGDCGLGIGDW